MMEPVAWMDDGTTRTGSGTTGFRVVHADTKATMPRASSDNFTVALVRLSDAEERIAELEAALADKAACLREVIRHAETEGNRYCEDEFGAPYIVNARANAAEALLKEADTVISYNWLGQYWRSVDANMGNRVNSLLDKIGKKP